LVAALCAGTRAPFAASSVAPRFSGAARCAAEVRWAAGKRDAGMVKVRCGMSVTEKSTGEEAAIETTTMSEHQQHLQAAMP
jgi:heat shock protein 90kDa beta